MVAMAVWQKYPKRAVGLQHSTVDFIPRRNIHSLKLGFNLVYTFQDRIDPIMLCAVQVLAGQAGHGIQVQCESVKLSNSMKL